jgi:16S rRNA (cytosine1402-N4)-methyltransferase
MSHIPVLLTPMLNSLSPKAGEIYVDATFGGGGYARALLEAAPCRVIGIDRDPDAIARGRRLEQEFPDRFSIHQAPFSHLKEILATLSILGVHGIVFDLGVSSYQIDEAARGFSFRFEGPLDMRMSKEGISAADVVNTYSEEELANIIFMYGEEKKSRAIARKIVAMRQIEPIQTTTQLADLVKSVVKGKGDGQHPATLTFQALRIFVNHELEEIKEGLQAAQACLLPGGRLAVITFHSLEDRLIKQFLKETQGQGHSFSRYLPGNSATLKSAPTFSVTQRKGIQPGEDEIRHNPRARSARLRVAVRLPSSSHEEAQ